MGRRMSVERCGKETNHALVIGTGFCKCAHAMFDFDPILDVKPRCDESRGGGGRTCYKPTGHKGGHAYECGR